jgi:hypothetical protein
MLGGQAWQHLTAGRDPIVARAQAAHTDIAARRRKGNKRRAT